MTLAILECLVDVAHDGDTVIVTDVVLTPENCRPNAAVGIDGVVYFVEELITTTAFRLTRVYAGADDTDVVCEIAPFTPEMASRAVLSQQLTKYEAKVALVAARGYGLFYNLVANSGANDPGPGNVSVDDDDWSQVAEVRFDVLDAAGIDATPEIDDWSNGTELKFESIETGAFAKFNMTVAATNQGPDAWRRIVSLEYIGGSGALATGEAVRVVHVRNGSGLASNARVADLAARAAHDGAMQGFAVLVEDIGDGRTAIFEKNSATSGDWSGAAMVTGPVGATGNKGWSPDYDKVSDGAREVNKLVGYVGGEGNAPTENVGKFQATAGGFTETLALAKDVRGTAGATGAAGGGLEGLQVLLVLDADIDIATEIEAGATHQAVTLDENDIVLLAAQTAGEINGLYIVAASGVASRHPDFGTYVKNVGALFPVLAGTYADQIWKCTSPGGGTIDVTDLGFASTGGVVEVPTITSWVAYTPSFTGFGTVANVEFFSRRVGDTLHIRGKFDAGTSTAVEARIELGHAGTAGGVSADSAKVPSITVAGNFLFGFDADIVGYTLIESASGYLTVGFQNASRTPLVKSLGNGISGSGQTLALTAEVPISGWS